MKQFIHRRSVAARSALLRAWWRLRTLHVPRKPEHVAAVGEFGFAYEAFGRTDAPPILLIAGFAQQMIGWDDAFCALLAARGFRVIRYDHRNIGRSASVRPPATRPGLMHAWSRLNPARWFRSFAGDHPGTLRDMADDAAGLLAALGIESAHVVGISMGGMIAQLMAIHHAARVRTLTSINSTTGDPLIGRPSQSTLSKLLAPAPKDGDGFAEHAVELWRHLRATDDAVEDEIERQRARRMLERGISAEAVRRQLSAVMRSRSWKFALGSVKAPTLVIHGERDPLVPVAAGHDTAQAIPGAKLLLLPGVGHALPAASWKRVIDAIAEHARAFERLREAASKKSAEQRASGLKLG